MPHSESESACAARAVVHFSTVHARRDTRIWKKEIASIADRCERPVFFYVADGRGTEEDESRSVTVMDIGAVTGGRFRRMSSGVLRMWRAVRAARPAVAHFHDPELIPVGFLLKAVGIRVVYDVHEDMPRQILGKARIPRPVRRPLAALVSLIEWAAGRAFDGIVAATPVIARRFPAPKTVTVHNFPLTEELAVPAPIPYAERSPHFAYVGCITASRGIREMVEAIHRVRNDSVRLQLAGSFPNSWDEQRVRGLPGWGRVDFHGWADRSQVASLLSDVRAGLVVLHPQQNYVDAYPVKMFEYMAAGVPVIVSDFPLWREIVDGAGCGLLVDPLDPDAIAAALEWTLEHTEEATAMGRRGRQAVERTYNWGPEADSLMVLYRRLLDQESRETVVRGRAESDH